MSLAKHYKPEEIEPALESWWQTAGIYHFRPDSDAPVYSIDTPPPTVSGHLHLGHVYSYTHTDLIARYRRMRGWNVYYPMGYDDNGLPTERLVEKQLNIKPEQVGREKFIADCLAISAESEKDYTRLWQRLGLSIDWRYTYRTIDEHTRRISQRSFIELYHAGLVYRSQAPAIWCPECGTAIAQAELNDLALPAEFVTLPFMLLGGGILPIATTRPELLPACVAVFVHPSDQRYTEYVGQRVQVPIFGQWVPILTDPQADPEKGTGAVMCCTFGDVTDVAWWQIHRLPHVQALDSAGNMTSVAGDFAGLSAKTAQTEIKSALEESGLLLARQAITHTVRVHERCDTPVEYLTVPQWFVRVLEHKEVLLAAGDEINWYPEHMQARYRAWVEGLNWDWCISRQRYFGVPFPVWYCDACGAPYLPGIERLPIDPLTSRPEGACRCGHAHFTPDPDVMDTWATSSLSPQIAGDWLARRPQPDGIEDLYAQVYPYSLRPQAHEIIRTWAFYSIVKSHFHFNSRPWRDVLISGWGIAGEGMGKISKSRGGGPLPPLEMIERYSADAVRYWAASTSPGKDAVISEEKIQLGSKLVTKLWNIARFSERFLQPPLPDHLPADPDSQPFTLADRWIMARLQQLIRRATQLLDDYEYAAAKSEIEAFFWQDLADNYLEMVKLRLYSPEHPAHLASRLILRYALLNTLKMLAPYLPYISEKIYQELFQPKELTGGLLTSIHRSAWCIPLPVWENAEALNLGAELITLATTVRRYKSENNLSLATPLKTLYLIQPEGGLLSEAYPRLDYFLTAGQADARSVTRAGQIQRASGATPGWLTEVEILGCRLAIES